MYTVILREVVKGSHSPLMYVTLPDLQVLHCGFKSTADCSHFELVDTPSELY